MLSTISFSVTSPALLEIYFVPPVEHPAKPITEILNAIGKIAFLNFFIKICPPMYYTYVLIYHIF